MQQLTIPPLAEGEIYLGGFVNALGDVTHTILLPGDNAPGTWQEQMDWAKSLGGDLPTRAELVIAYEQHRELFEQEAYWSNTTDTDPSYSGWAWCQHFYGGNQYTSVKNDKLRARAVRRLEWEDGFTFAALVDAYLDCRRTKRNSASALEFEANLELNLRSLFDDLADGSYAPGRSICFVVTRPKPREVWAAAFRDRIVHHLLYNRIGPRFERSFIADSCACIEGRRT
jgi:hypothetical protein